MIPRDTFRLTPTLVFVLALNPQREKEREESSESRTSFERAKSMEFGCLTKWLMFRNWWVGHSSADQKVTDQKTGHKEKGPVLHRKGNPAASFCCSWEDDEGFVLKRCSGWPCECDRCSLLFCSTWVFHFLLLPWVRLLWHHRTCPNGACLTSVWLQMGHAHLWADGAWTTSGQDLLPTQEEEKLGTAGVQSRSVHRAQEVIKAMGN